MKLLFVIVSLTFSTAYAGMKRSCLATCTKIKTPNTCFNNFQSTVGVYASDEVSAIAPLEVACNQAGPYNGNGCFGAISDVKCGAEIGESADAIEVSDLKKKIFKLKKQLNECEKK